MIKIDVEGRVGKLDLAVTFETGGRVTALFGRSGAGKSSILNMIAGLVRPARGRIEIDGRALFDSTAGIDVPVHARRIGYVFQEGRLFPHLTVKHNLLYGHSLNDRTGHEVGLEQIVRLLALDDLLERRPGDLSGGEKQRVAIGRALLAGPLVLLLDEPLSSLDPHRRSEILQYIDLMREQIRIPIIYVSHSVEEVVRLADTVVLMSSGKVVAVGDVEDVMGRPDLRPVGGVFEGGAVIDARVVAQDMQYELATLAFDGGTLRVTNLDALVGEPVRVRIRARDVSIALERPRDISMQNILHGKIMEIGAARSGIVDVSIAVGTAILRSRITRLAVDRLALAPGVPVHALIKAVSLDLRNV